MLISQLFIEVYSLACIVLLVCIIFYYYEMYEGIKVKQSVL